MVLTRPNIRLADLTANPVVRALVLSLLFHCLLFGFVEFGYRLGWWKSSLLSSLLLMRKPLPNQLQPSLAEQLKANSEREVPVVFVEVDPKAATEEAPKEAKYYSSQNSKAANREMKKESMVPHLAGTQDKVPKTTAQPIEKKAQPLQPTPIPEAKPEPLQPAELEKPIEESGPKAGETTVAKASERPSEKDLLIPPDKPEPAKQVRQRPRTLAAARQQQGMAGEKMRQEGGVRQRLSIDGLDVKASPFGTYDAKLIAAVQQRWYDLLEERDYARNYSGKVVLTFKLNSDGRITEVHVAESEVSDILALFCQRAVQDPAPFPPWPNDMKRLVGADYREVRFTFYYN